MSDQPNSQIRVLTVLGTRPEAVKLIPVVRAVGRESLLDGKLVLTGQHRQLVEQMLEPLGVRPTETLNIARASESLTELLAATISKIDPLYERLTPDMVIVQGDTTSALAAAVSAFYRRIPVAHVEAGLRSFDRFHPYPEEANRRMISALADLHLAPTRMAAENLMHEGISRSSIIVTGNTAVDSLLLALESEEILFRDGLFDIDAAKQLVLITLHRRESWGSVNANEPPLIEILNSLAGVARRRADVTFVYPVHPNPRVRGPAEQCLGGLPNVQLVDPLPYIPFVRLMSKSTCIVTDSGGIQEEAPSLGVPVLVLRETTERPEALQDGMNRIVGMNATAIQEALNNVLDQAAKAPSNQHPSINPYGDGHAAKRIVQAILHFHGKGPSPDEFVTTEQSQTATTPIDDLYRSGILNFSARAL